MRTMQDVKNVVLEILGARNTWLETGDLSVLSGVAENFVVEALVELYNEGAIAAAFDGDNLTGENAPEAMYAQKHEQTANWTKGLTAEQRKVIQQELKAIVEATEVISSADSLAVIMGAAIGLHQTVDQLAAACHGMLDRKNHLVYGIVADIEAAYTARKTALEELKRLGGITVVES